MCTGVVGCFFVWVRELVLFCDWDDSVTYPCDGVVHSGDGLDAFSDGYGEFHEKGVYGLV